MKKHDDIKEFKTKFEKIIDELNLSEPMSLEEQEEIIRIKNEQRKIILKKIGIYSISFAFFLKLRSFFLRIGINSSIQTISICFKILLAGSIISGSYIATTQIILPLLSNNNNINKEDVIKPVKVKPAIDKKVEKVFTPRGVIQFGPFAYYSSNDEKITNRVKYSLYRKIKYRLKKYKFLYHSKISTSKTDYSVVCKFFNKRVIVQIINSKTNFIEGFYNITIDNEEEIDKTISKLSREISSKLKGLKYK